MLTPLICRLCLCYNRSCQTFQKIQSLKYCYKLYWPSFSEVMGESMIIRNPNIFREILTVGLFFIGTASKEPRAIFPHQWTMAILYVRFTMDTIYIPLVISILRHLKEFIFRNHYHYSWFHNPGRILTSRIFQNNFSVLTFYKYT